MDSAQFRACLGRFATGVTIVTYRGPEDRRGITVNAFTSVSLEPPLVLISISKQARSHDLLAGAPFAVNVLTEDQELLAQHFAGHPKEDVEIQWIDGELAPRLQGVLAWMECAPWAAYEGGDHTLYLGEVRLLDFVDGVALGFYASRFVSVSGKAEPPVPYDPFELDER